MPLVVEWGHGRRWEVATVQELDALLDEIASEAAAAATPQAVQIAAGDSGRLDVVVGSGRSWLHHVPADLSPPYSTSVGEEDGDEPFVFYVAGDHHTEVARRNTIVPDAARQAVAHFAATGQLSPAVAWEEV